MARLLSDEGREEGGRLSQNQGEYHETNSINRGQNKANDQQEEKSGQTIKKPGVARKACITFPESEATLNPIVHTNKECHTSDTAAEPKDEGDHHIHNHAHKHTESQPLEARRWRKARAGPQLDTVDRDQ